MAIKNKVFWTNPSYRISKPLKEDIECDYLVVGGGVAGVSTAYFLYKRGAKNIVLIDKGIVAWGATGRAAGVLTPNVELDLSDLIETYGPRKGLIFWYGVLHGLHHMKKAVKDEKIDCDFEEDPTLYGQLYHKTFGDVLSEYKVQKKLHQQVHLLLENEIEDEIHAKLFKNAILSHQGASVSPLKYTQNLAMVLKRKDVRFYENTPLLRINGNVAATPKGKIKFRKKIILATDSDPAIKGTYFDRATIAITKRLTKKQLNELGLSHRDMVWDSRKSYHYFKLTKDNRLLIGFGDEKVSEKGKYKLSKSALKEIRAVVKSHFPKGIELEYAWSASFSMNKNHVPIIRFKDNRVYMVAMSGQPIATMAAVYIVNRLLGHKTSLDMFFK